MLFILLLLTGPLTDQPEREAFYAVLASESEWEIVQLIQQYEQQEETPLLNAYIGTLYLKAASFPATPRERIQNFRQGKVLIDKEIENNPTQVEMRFLRLMFQENSPGILNYKDNLEEDKTVIMQHFHTTDEVLKGMIRLYAKESVILNAQDFEP